MNFIKSNPIAKRGLLRFFLYKIQPLSYQKLPFHRSFSLSTYCKDDINKQDASMKVIDNHTQNVSDLKITNAPIELDTYSEPLTTEEVNLVSENEIVENAENSLSNDPDWYLNESLDPLASSEHKGRLPRWMTDSKNAPSSLVEPGPISAELLTEFLKEQHAQNVVTLDVRSRCEWTNFFIIAQGQSLRHLQAMSDSTQNFVKLCKPFDSELPETITLEGESNDEWIVLDAGNIIVHFMTESSRNLYQLEELWTKSPQEISDQAN